MENSTAMLANVILLTLDTQNRWVSEPNFKTQEIIDSLRKKTALTNMALMKMVIHLKNLLVTKMNH